MEKALLYTSHLYGLGGGARAALDIAIAMKEIMPTHIAYGLSPSAQVLDWLRPHLGQGLSVGPYRGGMEDSFDLIWNVDHFRYIPPKGKRNLAFVFFPYSNNVAPPQYELYGVSDYSSRATEEMWERPCQTLYLPINTPSLVAPKKKVILNVARFAAPSEYADKGHSYMIDAFKLLWDEGHRYELLFIGGLDYGHGKYLDHLMEQARNYPVRFIVNAPQDVVERAYAEAAIYWHPTGIGTEIPGAQEHLGLTIVEAMNCGAVPIAMNRGGPAEIVRDGYDGMLLGTPQDLFAVTSALLKNLAAWSLLGQRALVSAEPWADWEAFKQRIAAVVEERHIPPLPKPTWLAGGGNEADVTIVIPVHNQYIFTQRCLRRVYETAPSARVVVVDNASTDETPSLQGWLEERGWTYLRREVNDGFAASNMAALPYCQTPFVLMLNNDVEPLSPEWLKVLLAEMEDPAVSIVGPKLVYPTGRIQFGGMGYGGESLFYHLGYGDEDAPVYSQRKETFAVTGACLLCRREAFDLDTQMLLNYEDVDMCLRAAGKVIYQPACVLVHYEARTKAATPNAEQRIRESREAFLRKHKRLEEEMRAYTHTAVS